MGRATGKPKNEGYAPDGSHLKTSRVYWENLEKRNPIEVANLTLCEPGPGKSLQFPFLGAPVRIDILNRSLLEKSKAGWIVRDDPLLELAALIYFSQIQSLAPLGREIVGLADLKESHFFVGPHTLRLESMLERFGNDLPDFCQKARGLAAQLVDMADAAACVWPFPRIPLYFLLWQGDDEFPPRIRVLFDRSIDTCLPADAIWALVNRVGQAFCEV